MRFCNRLIRNGRVIRNGQVIIKIRYKISKLLPSQIFTTLAGFQKSCIEILLELPEKSGTSKRYFQTRWQISCRKSCIQCCPAFAPIQHSAKLYKTSGIVVETSLRTQSETEECVTPWEYDQHPEGFPEGTGTSKVSSCSCIEFSAVGRLAGRICVAPTLSEMHSSQ